MPVSRTYRAPFAPDGTEPVDPATAGRLLAAALSQGGDYADLFFEYRASSGMSFDEGILKSASRSVSRPSSTASGEACGMNATVPSPARKPCASGCRASW